MKNIGIDIGGTTIKSGIVDENCKVIETLIIDTQVEKGFEIISKNIVDMINKLIENASLQIDDIERIGVGIPGVADENGNIYFATNLYWTNANLGKILRINFPNQKIFVENDATVAGVAEHTIGAMKGSKNALMLTLGTGVGGGIIIDEKKYSGSNNTGSELGHMIIGSNNFYDCSCGNNGCFETYCSATAVINYALKLIDEGEKSILNTLSKEKITAKDIFDGYKKQDDLCIKVIDRFIEYMSIGIANIINVFAPEVIVLAGGMANAYDLYIDALTRKVHEKIIFKNLPFAKILKTQLGNDAGIIGAAMLK